MERATVGGVSEGEDILEECIGFEMENYDWENVEE